MNWLARLLGRRLAPWGQRAYVVTSPEMHNGHDAEVMAEDARDAVDRAGMYWALCNPRYGCVSVRVKSTREQIFVRMKNGIVRVDEPVLAPYWVTS